MATNDDRLGAALTERTELLGACWSHWADVLAGLAPEAWSRPTRLEGWTVAALAAHHAFFVQALGMLVGQPAVGPATVPDASAMLRGFNRPQGTAVTMAGAVAEQARQRAATVTHAELVEQFRVEAPVTLAAVRAAGPIAVNYFGQGVLPLAEAVAIGILEAVVHGLDLHAALRPTNDAEDGNRVPQPVALPDDALRFAVRLLADLADPVEFISAATGRSTRPVFPVLR